MNEKKIEDLFKRLKPTGLSESVVEETRAKAMQLIESQETAIVQDGTVARPEKRSNAIVLYMLTLAASALIGVVYFTFYRADTTRDKHAVSINPIPKKYSPFILKGTLEIPNPAKGGPTIYGLAIMSDRASFFCTAEIPRTPPATYGIPPRGVFWGSIDSSKVVAVEADLKPYLYSNYIIFNRDASKVLEISGTSWDSIKLYDRLLGKLSKVDNFNPPNQLSPESISVISAKFDPAGKVLALSGALDSGKGFLFFYNCKEKKFIHVNEDAGKNLSVRGLSADGSVCMTYDQNTFSFWDVQTGELKSKLSPDFVSRYDQKNRPKYSVLSPDGKSFLVVRDPRTPETAKRDGGLPRNYIVEVRSAKDGKKIFGLGIVKSDFITSPFKAFSFKYSPDGKYIARISKTFKIWNLKTGKIVQEIKFDGDPGACNFSADGKALIFSHSRNISIFEKK